jgi:hypothetical protein
MADNVSFKVYLKDPSQGEETEVRRFVVDKEVSTSLVYIKEKLVSVFPVLAEKLFSVSWTDEDGDVITIDTDEELILALTELAGPVYKLTATVRGAKRVEQPQEPGVGANVTHHGVTCDGCDKAPIVGFRYKCVVCDDYDLCGSCEKAGKHPGHNMMRISSPEVIWPQRLFKRIHKMQEKAEQRSRCRQEKQERKEEREEATGNASSAGAPPPPPPFFGRGRGMFRGCGRGGMGGMGGMGMGGPGMAGAGMGGMGMGGGMGAGRGGRGGQWQWQWPGGAASAWAGPTFEAMMQGWMGEHPQQHGAARDFAAGDHGNAHAEAQASAANAHASAHSAAQAAAEDAHTAAHAAAQAAQAAEEAFAAAGMPEGSGAEYLQRVGDFVAAALDPLGIDVQVDVETPGGQRTTVKPTVKPNEADEKKQDEAAGSEAAGERSASPSDDEEWTVLADKKPDAEAVSIPIQVLDKEVAPVYPTLPTTEATTTTTPTETATQDQGAAGVASAPPATAVHPDPRIQVALQAMMNMGFSNEGGWLANLLEAKDGDIGKVLDILQPVR